MLIRLTIGRSGSIAQKGYSCRLAVLPTDRVFRPAQGDRLEQADLATRKKLLNGLVSKIEVDPDEKHAIVHVRHFVFDHALDLRLADDEFS